MNCRPVVIACSVRVEDAASAGHVRSSVVRVVVSPPRRVEEIWTAVKKSSASRVPRLERQRSLYRLTPAFPIASSGGTISRTRVARIDDGSDERPYNEFASRTSLPKA